MTHRHARPATARERGAIVVCDNVVRFKREYRDYLELVRHPANGFESATLPFAGGFELSIWLP